MPLITRLYLATVLVFGALCLQAQDSLLLVNGRRIAYEKLEELGDSIEVMTLDQKVLYFDPDSVKGYSEIVNERRFFCKPNPDTANFQTYVFVERLVSGKLSLYEKTRGQDAIYLEKGERFEKIFDPIESYQEKQDRIEVFTSFIDDDDESLSYVQNPNFIFKFKEIMLVLEHYNQRNFEVTKPNPEDLRGTVYLYRTKFQKTKSGIKIKFFDGVHDLYIEDFIQLDVPIDYPSKMVIYDDYYKSEVSLSGTFEDQYYEVLYNKRANGFILKQKTGTELYMEFVKIREKVDKWID